MLVDYVRKSIRVASLLVIETNERVSE